MGAPPWTLTTLTVVAMCLLAGGADGGPRNAVETRGDVTLGGLFPVHEKGDVAACGRKVYNRGVQRLEAMMYAVDQINRDPGLLPGIELGVNILDTCSRDTYALNQSLNFVRSSPNTIDLTALECRDREPPRLRSGIPGRIIGVVGGSYSSVSIQVATLLRLFRVPQVSPASTAKDLSDKTRFEFFARTVPPDNYQAIAMVDVVKQLNWTYVSTVHSEGTYGENGIDVFVREASERGVCIAAQIKVHGNADAAAFDDVIRKLSKGSARAVVLFTRAEDARGLLLAASRSKDSAPFHWLASDGWGRQPHVVRDVEEVAEGALTVELHTEPIPGFDAYMAALTPENNLRNPWFEEYWQETFNCSLAKADPSNHSDHCAPGLRLGPDVGYLQESKVPFVVDAVYAFAHALHALQRDTCQGNGTCSSMLNMDGGNFYHNYLLKVNFTDLAGTQVKFNRMGDGLARYDISNYQRAENSSGYVYKTVGWWSETLVLEVDALAWTNGSRSVPTSTCSEPCGVGMIKRHHKKGDVCCWICDTCEEYEFVYNESTCADCGKGFWPYPDKRSCYELDVQYIPFFSPVAYGPIIISASGIAFTLATVGVFVRYNDTPLVRATGRELSYALLMGITLCFANTFVLLQKPSLTTCTMQRFSVGMGFCITYSALLTKTNRISRIFDSASKSARRPKFISPKSQVLITVALILVQTLGTFAWLVVEPPGTRFDYPDRRQVWLKCRIHDESFLLSQLYNILLICTCTVYAFKTRKIPENFNESKFIVFTMYTTCVIWLAFLPIYFTTRHAQEVQALTLCVSISLSAWVSLGCLFAPKVYIILFHPEKNVRRLTMSTTYRRRSGGRPSSSGMPTATTAIADHNDHNSKAGALVGRPGSGHYQACTPVGQQVDLVVSQSPGPTGSTSTNVAEGHEAAALL